MRTYEGTSPPLSSHPRDPMVQELKDAQLRIIKARCSSIDSDTMSPPLSAPSSGSGSAGINPGSYGVIPKGGIQLDVNGLVVPKKIANPCMESRECQDLQREIRWNAKAGISVLNTKSELERVMEKRNRHRKEQERVVEEETKKSPFQKMLEDRAKRLEMIESQTEEGGHSSEDSGHCSPEPESEFRKIHAQLTAGKFSS